MRVCRFSLVSFILSELRRFDHSASALPVREHEERGGKGVSETRKMTKKKIEQDRQQSLCAKHRVHTTAHM